MNQLPQDRWGWTDYFLELDRFINSLERQAGISNKAYADYAVDRLGVCIRNVTQIKDVVAETASEGNETMEQLESTLEELKTVLVSLKSEWQEYSDTIETSSSTSAYSAPTVNALSRGRPRFVISKEQLVYLRSLSFSWTRIASLLGVSRMTIYRRRDEYSIFDEEGESITDNGLDDILEDLRRTLPYVGETLVMGRIRAMGLKVSREQLRSSIRRTDPLNGPLRWGGNRRSRRPYSVPGPNCLWHIGE